MEESDFAGDSTDYAASASASAESSSVAIAESIWPISELTATVFENQIIITKVLAVLSAMGSAYIIINMIQRKKLDRTFDRLLVCLCGSDLISSISLFVASWVVPVNAPIGLNEVWEEIWDVPDIWSYMFPQAKGNAQTCTAQGFFLYFGDNMSVLFTGCIAVSFLLQVKFQFRDNQMRIAEYCFLAVSILFPLLTAVIILADKGFNAIPVGFCYAHMEQVICSVRQGVPWTGAPFESTISDYCAADDHHRGKKTDVYLLIFSGVPVVLVLVVNSVCMLMLFWSVRTQELRAARWSSTSASGKYQKRVFVKGMLYVGAFLAVRVPYMLSLFMYYTNPVAVHYVANFCLPLQGVLNVLIYSNFFNTIKEKTSSIRDSLVSTRTSMRLSMVSRESRTSLQQRNSISFRRTASGRIMSSSSSRELDITNKSKCELDSGDIEEERAPPRLAVSFSSRELDITNKSNCELDANDIEERAPSEIIEERVIVSSSPRELDITADKTTTRELDADGIEERAPEIIEERIVVTSSRELDIATNKSNSGDIEEESAPNLKEST